MASPAPAGASGASPAHVDEATENTPLLGPSGQAAEGSSRAAPSNQRYKTLWTRWTAVAIYRTTIVVLIIAVVLIAAHWPRMSNSSTSALCLTPACIHAASGYLTNLSPNYKNIDPCTNFDEFVCGGWRQAHDLRADQGMTDALGLISDGVTSTIRNILEGSYPGSSNHSSFSPQNLLVTASSTDQQNFDEIKEAYNACMDVDTITKRGITPIVKLIDELAGTFGNTSDYSDSILYLRKRGINAFFSLYVNDDDKNPETQIIGVGPMRSVGLPSKLYFQDKDIVAKYQDAVAKVLGAIKPNVAKIGPAADAAAALVQFESKLSAAAPDKADMDDVTKTYNLISVKNVSSLVPQAGLEKVLKQLVPSNYTLNQTVTAFPEVLTNISHIIAGTPQDVIHNFLYWRLITDYSGNVLGPEIKPWRQFQNVLQGKDADAEPERWRTCVSHVGGTLGWILSRFFVEAAFSAAAKDFGNQIISDIKSAYLKKFASLKWMDDDVKKVAAEKVHNIDQKVGYPSASPNIMDPEDLHKYYQTVNISNSYFENVLSSDDFETKKEWSALGKPTDMKEWGMISSTVNAYYNPPHNEIVFPAAIMQFPLFGVDLPSYISYGAFGAVAGHELSHAFDNNGRHFDLHGRYNNWWTNSTIQAFTAKAQCIVDEFNNFTVVGKDGPIHINGQQTLGENIADSGGLSAAFLAWNDRRKNTTTTTSELSLPGLDFFTHEQLFYISYGNAWCSKFRPAMLTNRVTTDEHSPDPIRIKGTVQNSRGFLEAFNCKVKEPTCELW